MEFKSSQIAPSYGARLPLISANEPHLSPRFTRSIYEHRFSEARQAERLLETKEIHRVADHVVEFLRQAVVALSPIIGEKSVSALYKRSLYLNRSKHPWLSTAYGELPHAEILLTLQDTVSRQTLNNAKTAVNDLLAIFQELLHNLIGESLTQRLLDMEGRLKAV